MIKLILSVALLSIVHAQPSISTGMALTPSGTTATLSGMVQDEHRNLLPGAAITVARTFPITTDSGPRSFSMVVNAVGRYSFSGLPPGSYKICPSAIGAGLLDPCLWSPRHPLIQ